MARPRSKEEVTLGSERIYEGRVVNLRVDTVRLPNGEQTRREVVEHSDAVVILALDAEGSVILVRQYRKAAEQELLELPAGGVEPGEELEAGARRELQEETGYAGGAWAPLVSFYASPGYCTERLYAFLAEGVTSGSQQPESDEDIALVRVSAAELGKLIASGEICDSKTIAAALFYLSRS